MKNKFIALYLVTLLFILFSASYAKRALPQEVKPIMHKGIEYWAPHDYMGCIEAWDIKSKEIIWRKQVYVIKHVLGVERDVQDVFIKSMQLSGNSLVIINEKGFEYKLDLKSLEVKAIKGSLAVEFKR
jgi:hypothetical protein